MSEISDPGGELSLFMLTILEVKGILGQLEAPGFVAEGEEKAYWWYDILRGTGQLSAAAQTLDHVVDQSGLEPVLKISAESLARLVAGSVLPDEIIEVYHQNYDELLTAVLGPEQYQTILDSFNIPDQG